MSKFKDSNKSKYIAYFLLIGIIWTIYDGTSFIYKYCLNGDVNVYYQIGRMLDTKCLYVDLADNKGPYMFFIGYLSNKLFNSMLLFYLIDLASVLTFSYFIYKYISLYCNVKHPFFTSAALALIMLPFVMNEGSPDVAYLGVNSYILLWILDYREDKDNTKHFFLFGLIATFILLTKLNIIFGPGICILYYFYKKFKSKFFFKEISSIIFGFILGLIPFFIYSIKTHSAISIISLYIETAMKYASDRNIQMQICSGLEIAILSFFYLIHYIKYKLSYSKDTRIFMNMMFIGNVISIIITTRAYFYYLLPLLPYSFMFTKNVSFFYKKREKNIYHFIYLIIYGLFLFGVIIPSSITLFTHNIYRNSTASIKNYKNTTAYNFYNDYKDEINKDTSMMLFLTMEGNYDLYFFNEQPNYKHYFTISIGYDQMQDVYEGYYDDIINKKLDYILCYIDGQGAVSRARLINNDEYTKRTINALFDNYEIENTYVYPNNKELALNIMVPKN